MAANSTSSVVAPIRGWAGFRWLIAAAGAGVTVGLLATRISTLHLVLAAVVSLLGIAVVVKLPEIGLLALVFVTFSNLSDVLAGQLGSPPTLMKLLVPLVATAVLVQRFWWGRSVEGWLRPALLVGIYGLACLLSLFAASDPDRTLEGLSDLVKDGIVVMLVVTLIQRGVTLRRVFWALLAAGLLMGTISVHQHLTGNFTSDYWGFAAENVTWSGAETTVNRVVGSIGDANFYGLIMVVLIPIAFDRIARRGTLAPRIVALWALVVCSMTVVFTYSRGAFIGLVGLLGFSLLIRRPRPRHLLAAIVVGALMVPLLPSAYVERLATLVGAMERPEETIAVQDESLRGRLSESLAAVQMFLDHPLTGVGLRNYPVRYQDYSQQIMLDPRSTQRATHNLYLEIASETGAVGLLAFGAVLWFLFRSIMVARRALEDRRLAEWRRMVDAVAIGLGGYLVGSMFLHAAHMRYFWLLAGIALSLPRVAAAESALIRPVGDHDNLSPQGV